LEKRGVVIGDRTAGAVMTAKLFPHAAGVGTVTFYGTLVTIGDLRMNDGGALEGVGIKPDELSLPTQADLASHRDPVLARAISRLGGTLTPEDAGSFYKRVDR
jgi:C-terminal processing protease CtpA/Prc